VFSYRSFDWKLLLIEKGFGDSNGQRSNARNNAYAFRHRNCATGVENVEEV
jgi:hypothetical protein